MGDLPKHVKQSHQDSCLRKAKFAMLKHAASAATGMNRRYAPRRFEAYWCTACHGYHVGSIKGSWIEEQRERLKDVVVIGPLPETGTG